MDARDEKFFLESLPKCWGKIHFFHWDQEHFQLPCYNQTFFLRPVVLPALIYPYLFFSLHLSFYFITCILQLQMSSSLELYEHIPALSE